MIVTVGAKYVPSSGAHAFRVANSGTIRNSTMALLISAVALFSQAAFANSTPTGNVLGKANGTGCVGCHGTPTDATISVAITVSAILTAGSIGTYPVTATKTAIANGTKLGVDVRVSDGTLSVNSGQSTVQRVSRQRARSVQAAPLPIISFSATS